MTIEYYIACKINNKKVYRYEICSNYLKNGGVVPAFKFVYSNMFLQNNNENILQFFFKVKKYYNSLSYFVRLYKYKYYNN